MLLKYSGVELFFRLSQINISLSFNSLFQYMVKI